MLKQESFAFRRGRFKTIFQSYKERKLKTPEVIEGENYIKCILPRKGESVQTSTEDEDLQDKIISLMDIIPELTVQDVMRHFSVSRSTAVRKLNDLLKRKLIIRIGKARSSRYIKP